MKLLLKLAWRNIWRNKRRSLLTLLAISFATFASIAMRGIQLGTYEVNIKNIVGLFTGYLQIQQRGYQGNPSVNKSFIPREDLITTVENISEIKGYAPRVLSEGLISFRDNSQGAAIFGIIPEKEKTVSTIMNKVKDGKFFLSDSTNEIVIGYKLLQNLNAKIGDEAIILSQGFDGSLGNLKFKIVGTIKLGSPEFDGMAVCIGLRTAQELLGMYNRINSFAISLDDLYKIPEVQEELKEKISDENLKVLSWEEIMPDFKQSIEFDNVSGIFFLGILIVIVTFGILNTVLMSVTERFREFGVTLSIGMLNRKLVYLIFLEAIYITIIGLIIGNIIGYFINLYIVFNPIEFGGEFASMYEEFGWLPVIESTLQLSIFINTSLSILVISLLACIYPVYKVYKLEPLKGIRYT
jgi:ABC-type lipoprotein release transport system permease subunit